MTTGDFYGDLNGKRITEAHITIPWIGLWFAHVSTETAQDLPTVATLQIAGLSLTGYVYRGKSYAARTTALIVAGKGGWKKIAEPKSYQNPAGVRLSVVLADLAREVGEDLPQASADPSLGLFWVRERAAAERTLNRVASTWYANPNGSISIRDRDAGMVSSKFELMHFHPDTGAVSVATETPADWVPGKSFSGPTIALSTIGSVTHTLSGGTFRTEVLTA